MHGISKTEQEVFTTVRKSLLSLWGRFKGLDGLEVVRSNNLTQQGRVTAPTLYMARGLTVPRGSPRDFTQWDRDAGRMVYRNVQVVEMEMLLQAMVDMQCVNDARPGDVLNMASRIMQTSLFIRDIYKSGIQVLRIQDNKHTVITNDRDQYEAVPLLSVIFVYNEVLESEEPVIDSFNFKVRRV